MQTPQFKNQYKKLNPEQKEAVDTIEGPVMVVAGPGTGKTQILTLRIANILLKTQINPENILALTFSDSAARQMRARLTEIIGTPAYRVTITTFHSFANSIIQGYPEEFEDLLSAQSITEVEQIEVIEKILAENEFTLIKPFGDPLYYIKKILDAINDLKKEGIDPQKFKKSLEESKTDWENIPDLYHEKGRYKGEMKGKYADQKRDIEKNQELLLAYELYEKQLRTEKKYDFNDMLIEVIKVLEKNKRLLLLLQEKYQYFLVDEHQDSNAAQNKLVEILASFYETPNLFVVGDEKQAIFRFQGASLENFFYFKKLYPDAKLINLTQNYRSQQIILDASHSVIEKNLTANILFETVIKLQSQKGMSPAKIKLFKSDTFFEEFQGVASEIKKKVDSGTKLSEIAILGRNNKDLLEIQTILDHYEIPSSLVSDNDLLTNKAIQKIILFLRVVLDPLNEANLVKAMHIDSLKIDPFDIYRLLAQSKKDRINLLDKIISLKKKEAKNLGLESFSEIQLFLKNLKIWQKTSINLGIEKLFVSIFETSGLKAQIVGDYETFSKVNNLFELIKEKVYQNPNYSLEDFLKFLDITILHNLQIRGKSQVFESETVKLMTAHKSKGLEFDEVFIIQAFDGHWGNKRKFGASFKLPWEKLGIKVSLNEDENEDERRLFYVAMTRARKNVFISFSNLALDGKEQLPSQFISEINPELIEEIDIKTDKKIEEIILSEFIPKPISAKNAQVIKQLFMERGLSVTALSNFLECPWKWFFRNLLLLPDSKTMSLIFGSAIHIALNNYLKSLEAGKGNEKILMLSFIKALDREYLTEIEKKRLINQGEKVLQNFYQNVGKHWQKGMIGEMSIKGVKLQDGLILNGRIDLIEPVGKENLVIIHDFKTGKPKPRRQIDGSNPAAKYNYFRQLAFYKLLLDKHKQSLRSKDLRNNFYKVNSGSIDFIEADEKGKIHSEVFDISESDVLALEKEVISVGNQILNLDFWDQTCGEKNCEWCDLRKLIN